MSETIIFLMKLTVGLTPVLMIVGIVIIFKSFSFEDKEKKGKKIKKGLHLFFLPFAVLITLTILYAFISLVSGT